MAKGGLERADATARSTREGYHRCKPGLRADLKARRDMPILEGCAVQRRHPDRSWQQLRCGKRPPRRIRSGVSGDQRGPFCR